MNKKLYFLVLEKLSPIIGFETDITKVVIKYFPQKNTIEHYWDLPNTDMEKFLNAMKENRHIVYEFRDKKIMASITVTGYAFYSDHRKTFWAYWFSIIAIFISLYAAIKNTIDTPNDAKSIKQSSQSVEKVLPPSLQKSKTKVDLPKS